MRSAMTWDLHADAADLDLVADLLLPDDAPPLSCAADDALLLSLLPSDSLDGVFCASPEPARAPVPEPKAPKPKTVATAAAAAASTSPSSVKDAPAAPYQGTVSRRRVSATAAAVVASLVAPH
ncbi:hypothetical protein PINS_up015209 [Pythium insidiosum]|nr:hypothetical protein PINS_up015209 [Pythium insidiosum]